MRNPISPITRIMLLPAAALCPAAPAGETPGGAILQNNARVLFATSFEPGQPEVQAPRHQVVTGAARTGDSMLMGQADGPNQAPICEIPFDAARGTVLHVSFWVRSDNRSACSAFVRFGEERTRIGHLKAVAVADWQQFEVVHRLEDETSGVVQIAAPSSHSAPSGKMWIDDVRIIEREDECEWPDAIHDFPAITPGEADVIWAAMIEHGPSGRSIVIDRIDDTARQRVCTLRPEGLTGIAPPAVAATDQDCLVAFPVEQEHRWRIAYTFVTSADRPPPAVRHLPGEGTANISPAMARSGDGAWIVWESNAGGRRGIQACHLDRSGPGTVQRISHDDANAYNPAIVGLSDGALFAAWDTLREGSADIYGAWCRDGNWQPPQRITSDGRLERHPSLAARGDSVWMAWQAQSYRGRTLNNIGEQRVVVARLEAGSLQAPRSIFRDVATPARFLLRPRIGFDDHGRLWLTARESIAPNGGWLPMAWCYGGRQWSEPMRLMYQQGRWRPIHLVRIADGLAAACQFDDVTASGPYAGVHDAWRSGVTIKMLPTEEAAGLQDMDLEPLAMPETRCSPSETAELSSADLPRQAIEHGGETLSLFWGDLHEHTDISICARRLNPPGHDLLANERDIEKLDFCALTDHGYDFDPAIWAYNGEQTRNNHDPGRFVTFLGQEWTSKSNPPAEEGGPNRYGHRNLIYRDPYYPRIHDAFDGNISPAELWADLKGVDVVSIPHQLADWQGKGKGNPPTDWSYVDEKMQPLAEIFQNRQSYEYLGCPRQAPDGTPFKGHYLQDAWARGLIIGTIASPDHGGGGGKVGVWAGELTRGSIFEALQARHTFGTSGARMSLLLRAGDAFMGDKTRRPPGPITFEVRGLALHDIHELVIFRNNQVVHRAEPGKPSIQVEWVDPAPPEENRLWYYARIHAADDELAWSSPIWFLRGDG